MKHTIIRILQKGLKISLFLLITGITDNMQFILLFGVIAKLAFASSFCDVGTLDLGVFDITKASIDV